tara:strand:- start:420 stop:860 length:441 start_codon:yes stop_codon:yes gene_type:complete
MREFIKIPDGATKDEINKIIIARIKEVDNVTVELHQYFQHQGRNDVGSHYDFGADVDGNPIFHTPFISHSCSVLDNNDYEGGNFEFVNDDNELLESIGKDKHYKNGLLFDVSWKHRVTKFTSGVRLVRVFFYRHTNTDYEPTTFPK